MGNLNQLLSKKTLIHLCVFLSSLFCVLQDPVYVCVFQIQLLLLSCLLLAVTVLLLARTEEEVGRLCEEHSRTCLFTPPISWPRPGHQHRLPA